MPNESHSSSLGQQFQIPPFNSIGNFADRVSEDFEEFYTIIYGASQIFYRKMLVSHTKNFYNPFDRDKGVLGAMVYEHLFLLIDCPETLS